MAMTPSQLSIIVKSQGIEKATQDLDKLAKAAASVDAETKAFVIAQSKLAESNQKVSKSSEATARGVTTQELAMIKLHEAANKMNAVYDRQHAAQQKLVDNAFARALKEQEANTKKAEDALAKHNKELEKQAEALKKTSHHGNIFNNTLRSMTTAALAYMGVNFATGIFKSADAWASMQAKLSLATGSMNAAKVVQEDLYKISQDIRVPLEDTAKLYNRMVHPLMMMGKTSKDTTDMVSSMGYALKLSGATGQEAASAMLQFSQSMNAGRLNGGEFNSIAEASPNILRAIEAELVRTGRGAELSSQGLKKMAAEGQLTAKLVSEAMLRALPQWRKDFESLPLTVDGAITRIKNMWEKSIGNLAQDTGFAQNFTKLLGQLETAIPAFAKTIVTAFSLIIDYSGLLLKSLTAIAAIGLANWAYTSFMAVQGLSVGMKAATLATNTLAGSMALLQSSMMWFAGAAVGIGLIVKGYQELNKERMGLGEATSSLEDSHKKYIKELEAETSMLIKQVNLMREKRGESSRLIDPYEKSSTLKSEEALNELLTRKLDVQNKLAATQKEINNLQKATGTGSDSVELGRARRLEQLNAIVEESKKKLKGVSALELEEIGKKKMLEFAADKAQKDSAIARTKEAENKLNQMTQFKEKATDLFNQTKKLADAELAAGNISKQFYDDKIKAAERLRDAKQSAIRDITPELTNLDKVNKLMEEQNTLNKEWIADSAKKLTAGERFRIQVEAENASLEETLKRGTSQNKLLTELEKKQIRKTLATNKEAIAHAEIVDSLQKAREIDQDRSKRVNKAAVELSSEEARLAVLTRQLEIGEETNIAKQQQSIIEAEIALSAVIQTEKWGDELVLAQKTLKVRQDTLKVMQNQEIKDSATEEAKKYEDAYQAANKKISDGLYSAIGKGSENAIKKLTQDLKSWAARLVLSPIINPISQLGASIISPNAASAAGGIQNSLSQLGSVASGAYNFLSNPLTWGAQASTALATGIGEIGATMGSEFMLSVSSMMQGGASSGLAGTIASGLSGLATVAPYLAAAAVLYKGLSMGEKQKTGTTVTGNLGTQDLMRNVSWNQEGGFLRGDRSGVWSYGLSNSTAIQDGKAYTDPANMESDKALLNQLTSMYSAMKVASGEYAKALGLNAESIKNRTDSINFSFGKTAEETSTNISKAFEAINNSIAKELLGSLSELALQNETSGQTMARLATNITSTNAMFKALGYSLFSLDTAGIKAADAIVTLFGGLDKFQATASSYYDNFYNDIEKTKVKTDAVTKALKDLGKEMPTSREAFRLMVEQAKAAGNNELFVGLMKVSSAFAEVVQWADKAGDAVKEAVEKMDYNNTDPMFPDMSTLRDNAREVFNELSQTAQKWLSISKQASDVRASINTILWGNSATQDAAVKKSEKLWKMMATDITVEQKLSLAGELKDAILSKYQLERESVTKLIDFSKQLRTYVDGLKLGSLSPLTMTQKLAEARRQYETTLAKARAGDTTAQGALTGSASAYLEIAKTAYASGEAYQSIFTNITSTLESMTLDTRTADEKLIEINKAQEAELIKLVLQLNTVESVAASYYATTIQNMSSQLTLLQGIYTQMGVFDGVATELNGLPAEIAAALSGTFGRTSGEDYVKALYSKYANKTGNQIDQEGMQYWTREFELFGREYVLKAFQDSVAKTTRGVDVPPSPFAAPPMATARATQMTEQIATLKEEIVKLREDAQLQTIALMETLTLTSKQNADRIVEGTTEGMDKNNPNWNRVTIE